MKEIKRITVIEQVVNHKLSGAEAAKHIGLSVRQVRRLVAKYRGKGVEGIIHGNRGRIAHNRVAEKVRVKIQELAGKEYQDYNDSHFTEELADEYGLVISRSTVRRIRREMGQKSPHKRRPPRHRSRRERKPKAGMLLQTDGSRHDWLEGRGPWLTLIAYIDDATNQVLGAVFREEEDAAGYFLGLQEVCLQQGIPAAIYADRHTIFQSQTKATLNPESASQTQFGRLLSELGIELIAAQSPQAKGRIERLWGTFQDRLVKALRKAGASTLEEANHVIRDFIPKYNQRFSVMPAMPDTAYVPWPEQYLPNNFFCFKHSRIVANDNTVSFAGHKLQIPLNRERRSYAKAHVELRQHLDGSLEICYKGHSLVTFEPADQLPVRVNKFSPAPDQSAPQQQIEHPISIQPTQRKPYKPPANHPWRKPFLTKPKEPKS